MISYITIIFTVLVTSNADKFNPELQWLCTSKNIVLTLKTSSPFDGIIVSSNGNPNCRFYGNGTTITTFSISEDNDCGLLKQDDSYSVTMEVHQHRLLILSNDRIFKISCKTNSVIIVGENDAPKLDDEVDTNSTDIGFTIGLKNPVDDKYTTELIFSEPYDVMLNMKTKNDINGYFKVHNCTVYSDKEIVYLIDNRGCSIDTTLINEFKYYSNYAVASVPSMFKFRDNSLMKIKCKVMTCDYFCKPNCGRQMDSPLPEVEDYNKIARVMGVEEITNPEQLPQDEPLAAADAVLSLKVSERQIRSCPKNEIIVSKPIEASPIYYHPVILVLFGIVLFQFIIIIFCCICSKCLRRKRKVCEPSVTDNWAVDEPRDYSITPINTNTLIIGNNDTYGRRNYYTSSFKRNHISKDFSDYYPNAFTTDRKKSNETLHLSTFNPHSEDIDYDQSRRSVL